MSLLGKSVKDIRIVDTLGRGGMGEVYVGFDEKLKRKVALKSIRGEQMRLPEIRARFLREARILSQLDHPNICRIYEYIEGEENDFLVLELIRGTTLKRRVRQGELDDRERLDIASQIADVLVSAHAAGVVHRDLKPENVMLTEAGEVKVLDFGLARSHEFDAVSVMFDGGKLETPLPVPEGGEPEHTIRHTVPDEGPRNPLETAVGMVMGTPGYMSPEQSTGQAATAASDIYSFGLMLQELYTEDSAYEKGLSLDELLPRVRDGHTKPVEGISKDLASLINRMKAVAPEGRPSAAEVAERLHWIREKPRRRLRRLLVALALVATIGGTAKYTVDLNQERERAIAARNQAEDLVRFMFEDLYDRLEPVGQLELLDSVATQARDFYEGLPPDAEDSTARRTRAAVQREIGKILEKEGKLDLARASLESALAGFESLHRQEGDDDSTFGLVATLDSLAGIHQRQGDLTASEELIRRGLSMARELVELDEDPRRRALTGKLLRSLGSQQLTQGDLQSALESFREARAISQSLRDAESGKPDWSVDLARAWNGIGRALLRQGRNEEARDAFEKERETQTALVAETPSNSLWRENLAEALNYLGETHQNLDELEASLAAFEEAKEIIQALTVLDPKNLDWRYALAQSYERVGKIRKYQERLAEARVAYEDALSVMEELVATDRSNADWMNRNAFVLVALGDVVESQGDGSLAREYWQEAADLVKGLTESEDGEIFETASTFYLDTRAMALMHLGQDDEKVRELVEILLDKGWQKKSFLELAQERGLYEPE